MCSHCYTIYTKKYFQSDDFLIYPMSLPGGHKRCILSQIQKAHDYRAVCTTRVAIDTYSWMSVPISTYCFPLQRCFDGGFTSNIPLVSDPNIISVTPFSGESSICPPMESHPAHHVVYCDQPFQVTSQNLSRLRMALYPTSAEALEELLHQGYSDSLRFFKQKGQYPLLPLAYHPTPSLHNLQKCQPA